MEIELTRRQKNIIRGMCAGEEYYSMVSPRMTLMEAECLSALGFRIQSGSIHGADRSAGMYYAPLVPDDFTAKAKEAGLI